jgi:hypothetical protein
MGVREVRGDVRLAELPHPAALVHRIAAGSMSLKRRDQAIDLDPNATREAPDVSESRVLRV